jgi:hypothetical protein
VRFRHYDPTPGMCRWLERDPAGYQDGPSLYSYLGRNPMAGTDPYGLFYSGSGITVIAPDQIRPPVPAHELVQPPRYGLKLAAIWPGSPGYDEILAQAEALSAIAKSNAERGVDEGGGVWGALEQIGAFFVGFEEGLNDGRILILDNLTCGWVPGLNTMAAQVRTANAGSMAYTVADWSAAVGTTLMPGAGALKMLGIGSKTAKAAKTAGAAAKADRVTKTTIIGENMKDRVIPFAEKTGARTLPFAKKSPKEWDSLTRRQQWKLNDGALRARIREGDAFRYIGRDPRRSGAARPFDLTGSELLRLTERGVRYDVVPSSEVLRVLGSP